MLRIEMELRRDYPYGLYAGHALGYVGLLSPEDAAKLHVREMDPFIEVGKSGVEKAANLKLMGKNGRGPHRSTAWAGRLKTPSYAFRG